MNWDEIRPKNLWYTEMAFLQMYRDMFGKRYNPQVDREELKRQHLAMQRLAYFMEHPWGASIHIGDFGFLWDNIGPASQDVEYALYDLDRKPETIKDFYKIDANLAVEHLFVRHGKNFYQDKIEIIKSNCPEGYSLDKWLYTLICLYYLRETMGKLHYESAAEEFVYRRPDVDMEILPKAWQTCEEIRHYDYGEYHKKKAAKNGCNV